MKLEANQGQENHPGNSYDATFAEAQAVAQVIEAGIYPSGLLHSPSLPPSPRRMNETVKEDPEANLTTIGEHPFMRPFSNRHLLPALASCALDLPPKSPTRKAHAEVAKQGMVNLIRKHSHGEGQVGKKRHDWHELASQVGSRGKDVINIGFALRRPFPADIPMAIVAQDAQGVIDRVLNSDHFPDAFQDGLPDLAIAQRLLEQVAKFLLLSHLVDNHDTMDFSYENPQRKLPAAKEKIQKVEDVLSSMAGQNPLEATVHAIVEANIF